MWTRTPFHVVWRRISFVTISGVASKERVSLMSLNAFCPVQILLSLSLTHLNHSQLAETESPAAQSVSESQNANVFSIIVHINLLQYCAHVHF